MNQAHSSAILGKETGILKYIKNITTYFGGSPAHLGASMKYGIIYNDEEMEGRHAGMHICF